MHNACRRRYATEPPRAAVAKHINGKIDVEVLPNSISRSVGAVEAATPTEPPVSSMPTTTKQQRLNSGSGAVATVAETDIAQPVAPISSTRSAPSNAGMVGEGWVGTPSPTLVPRSLDSVRDSLIRQEETIIFSLIEREQFRCNPVIYTERDFRLHKDGVADMYGRDATFLEYMLCETEKLHARGGNLHII